MGRRKEYQRVSVRGMLCILNWCICEGNRKKKKKKILFVYMLTTSGHKRRRRRKKGYTHTHTLTTISGTDRSLAALVLLNPTRYIAAPSLIRSQAHSMASLSSLSLSLLLLLLLPSYCWLGKPLCIYSYIYYDQIEEEEEEEEVVISGWFSQVFHQQTKDRKRNGKGP
jgi:hypothetical protein